MAVFLRLIDAFRETRPDLSFEVVYYTPSSIGPAYEAAASEGAAPSIVIAADDWARDWRARGLVDDISGLMPAGLEARLAPTALARVSDDAGLAGLPLEMRGVVLFANRALYPRPAATVEQLVEVMQASSRTAADLPALEMGARYTASFLEACQGAWMGQAGAPAFRGPAGLCWLELIQRLGSAGRAVYNSDADLDAFISGRAPWLIAGTWQLEPLLQAIGEEALAVDPWPAYEAGSPPLVGYVWTEVAYLSVGLAEEALEAAWTFLVYLLSPGVQQQLAALDGPAHIPAVNDVEYADPLMGQAFAALNSGLAYPAESAFGAYLQPLERAIAAIQLAGADPERVLERAEREIQLSLAVTPTPP